MIHIDLNLITILNGRESSTNITHHLILHFVRRYQRENVDLVNHRTILLHMNVNFVDAVFKRPRPASIPHRHNKICICLVTDITIVKLSTNSLVLGDLFHFHLGTPLSYSSVAIGLMLNTKKDKLLRSTFNMMFPWMFSLLIWTGILHFINLLVMAPKTKRDSILVGMDLHSTNIYSRIIKSFFNGVNS